MTRSHPQIVGIVNITEDSFSDGGRYIEPSTAVSHAKTLLTDGADIIELGAASSNPHAEHVPPDVEVERLSPVLASLKELNANVSIDTTKPEVQLFGLTQGVQFLNDIRGFPDATLYEKFRSSNVMLVVMHSISDLEKAVRVPKTPRQVFDSIVSFFDTRLVMLRDAGIPNERIVIDPGMGFFLASNPEPSLGVLAHIAEFKKRYSLPVMISVSRKSFLKNLATPEDYDIQSRTLAAELFAAQQGVDYIRTHDVRALHQALQTLDAIKHIGIQEKFPERQERQ